jgi:hypothetical protein
MIVQHFQKSLRNSLCVDIYLLFLFLYHRPHLQGPVSILPQSHDNYGVDSCSILVMPTLPPTVVIAETTGKMHHALLLEADDVHDTVRWKQLFKYHQLTLCFSYHNFSLSMKLTQVYFTTRPNGKCMSSKRLNWNWD